MAKLSAANKAITIANLKARMANGEKFDPIVVMMIDQHDRQVAAKAARKAA